MLTFCLSPDCRASAVLKAVERINAAIREGSPGKTVEELMNPEAQLPEVYPSAADLYQRELASLQQQSPEVPSESRALTLQGLIVFNR